MLLTATKTPIQHLATAIFHFYPRMLGALFIFTSIQKIRQPDALRTVMEFDGFPPKMIEPMTWTVVGVEIVLGALLISFIWLRRTSLMASIGLLSIYIVQLGYLLIRDNAPSCGCLEGVAEFEQARMKNALSLARNICLILPALWTWAQIPRVQPNGFPMEENK